MIMRNFEDCITHNVREVAGDLQVKFNKGIPEGWEVKSLSDICVLQSGYAFKSANFTDEKTKNVVVRMGNFRINNGLQFNDNVKYLNNNIQINEKFKLKKGDFLIVLSDVTRSGSIIGNVGIVPEDDKQYVLNQRVSKIKLPEKYYYYIYGVLSSVSFKNHCLSRADSATVLNLSNKDFYEYKLLFPPDCLVSDFSNKYKNYLLIAMKLTAVNQNLKETRDRLLTRLISGKLSVEDLDIQFPPSMTEQLEEIG